jgi:hypothetical protein
MNPLRQYLESEGIAFNKFAAKLGVNRPVFHLMLSDTYNPSCSFIKTVEKLTHGLVKYKHWAKLVGPYKPVFKKRIARNEEIE